MKATLFLGIIQLLAWPLAAQFSDDFSAGTLAAYWQGAPEKFAVSSGTLQLDDLLPASNNITDLYTLVPTSTAAETTWSLTLRCDFAPSTSNYTTVYLATDLPPVAGAVFRGYYLKVGGISGANDALELYRQDGSSSTLLLSGPLGAAANDPVSIGILVRRTAAGEWILEADYSGGENYDPQGSVVDATYPEAQYFGLTCRYTATRNTAFTFDNILIDPVVVDSEAPLALSAMAESANSVIVRFNEPLAAGALDAPANYTLNNGLGAAQTVAFADGDRTRLALGFGQSLVSLTTYTLTLVNVADLAGNVNASQNLVFDYLLAVMPLPGDLVLTEIFPNPTPPVGLPNFEYVEIYNASNQALQLGGLGLSTGSTPRLVDEYVLLPQAYVTLCSNDAAAELGVLGPVVTLASFPALTNSGDELILTNAQGQELVNLVYDLSWYQDPLRADGGYSLELIDLALTASCPGNWRASTATQGGTPGQPNAVLGTAVATQAPVLLTAFAPSAMEIIVRFDAILGSGVDFMDLFAISPTIDIGSAFLEPDGQSVHLFLSEPLAENTLYEVTAAAGISDCLGNTSTASSSVTVGLTTRPVPGDLLINEILFNPYTGGVDFLELYNPGPRILNLQGLRLRNDAITSGTLSTIVETDYVLLPGAYVVFTSDPANILANYIVPQPAALIENDLPSLGDGEGNITVLNASLEVLDALNYTEDWHSRLLSDRNGVSLERLRSNAPTQGEGNWASAASTVGFATPTGRNSQDRQSVIVPTDNFFSLPEKTFSPDGDGFQDYLEIQYTTDQAGYVAKLLVFDAQGRMVQQLQRLELLAGQGSFLWDGSTEADSRARLGIYIIAAEIFTPQGDTIKEKLTCVLAGRLD